MAEAALFDQPDPPLVYDGPADFVVTHGRFYIADRVETLLARHCYANAIAMAGMRRWKYVEGYALPPIEAGVLMRPIPHAWSVDESHLAVEVTWPEPAAAYLGVEFSLGRADDASWNGDACVLLDEKRGWPLFQRPWEGEDYVLAWPVNPRLEMLERMARGDATWTEYLAVCTEEIEQQVG